MLQFILVIDMAYSRLASWRPNCVSFAGRTMLAQFVLQALPSNTT